MIALLMDSDRKGKRYKMEFRDKTVYFGSDSHENYTMHKDDVRRFKYLRRHGANENWNQFDSPGALSRWLLWEKKDLDEAIKDYEVRFKIHIINKLS